MAAKLGFELVKQAMLKLLMKKGDDGILLTLPKNEIVDYNAKITMDRLIRNGIDPDSLTSPDQVINVLDNINNQIMNKARVIPATSAEGKAITEKLFGKKGEVISFKDKIEAMKKSGDIVDPDNLKVSEKVTEREMFKNSNLNKKDSVTETVSYIKTLEPMDAMKEANSVIGRKGKYKNLTPEESKKILTDTEDHIFERDIPIDPEDMATGGRAGHYTGGIVDVEPSLDDIGHGSDALMARTRLVSPGNQATTSTGLNYLLAEDNDNMRVPFADGKSFSESELLEFNKAIKEKIKKGGRSNMPVIDPEEYKKYLESFKTTEAAEGGRIGFSAGGGGRRAFLKLMATLGGGVAAAKSGILGLGGKEVGKQTAKEVVKSAGSGGQVPPYFLNLVKKIKNLGDDVTPSYAVKDRQKVTKYKEYELTEDVTTGEIQIFKRSQSDEAIDRFGGENATEEVFMRYKPSEDIIGKNKKPVKTGPEYEENTSYISNNRENTGGILDEVDGVTDDVVQEGTVFEDTLSEFGKADGGRIGLFMGGGLTAGKGLLKNMLKFMSKDGSHKKSPAEILKMMNPKQYEKLLNNPKYQGQVSSEAPEGLDKIIQDMIGKTKTDRSDMVGDIISTSRKIKKTDDDIIDYKNKIIKDLMDRGSDKETAEQFAETLALQVSKAAGKKSTPKITEQGLLELENIQKNLVTKDRKLQATGGLTTMLGE